MKRTIKVVLASFLFPICLASKSVSALNSNTVAGQSSTQSKDSGLLIQFRECQQEIWSATQSTAWQRWRETQGQGYAVSKGVYPCYQYDTRGYCFVVFYSC